MFWPSQWFVLQNNYHPSWDTQYDLGKDGDNGIAMNSGIGVCTLYNVRKLSAKSID